VTFEDWEEYPLSEQDGKQNITLKQVPAPYDKEDLRFWKEAKEYWKSKGQPWRLMPEIDEERQKFLAERRSITPNRSQGIYPFKDIKLDRADIEWLLATHENGRGPIDWNDESQRGRYGLDLRGADLRDAFLSYLPLACMGKAESESEAVFEMTFKNTRNDDEIIHLEGAVFHNAHLELADFCKANLVKAEFGNANLERADFYHANLKGAQFENANLKEADFRGAHLAGANLREAHLERANLREAHLEGADFFSAHLEETNLIAAHLEGADLRTAFFNGATKLCHVALSNLIYGAARLSDIHWNDVNVTLIDWSAVSMLGDEYQAKKNGVYPTALRANRQLSIVLRNQGLNEDSARFAYRAQLLQRKEYKRLRKKWQYLFSLFLDLLSGYGYKSVRCFIAYLLVILAFATTYFIIGHKVGPVLSPLGSIVFSMTSFHGRGFSLVASGLTTLLLSLPLLKHLSGYSLRSRS
jgi:uncharacterized protein YjbI with pentapeptide repeats